MSTATDHPGRDERPTQTSATAGRRFVAHMRAADSYGLVLIFIVASYALAVSLHGAEAPSVVLFAQILTVWFALRTSKAKRGVLLLAGTLLLAAAVVGIIGLFAGTERHPLTFVFVVSCLLYTIAPISIVRHIAFRQAVDEETMLGAICAYLLIGMAFAFMYYATGALQAVPFFGSNGNGSISQYLFFSFTTLSTTGYGNLVPAGQPGQSLAVSEMILGQLFLITAVGKIVTAWRPRAWKSDDPR
ncbi:MAG: potassium channel family protein [Actinomycetota bacterium]